jgi:hypothetical protein
VILWEALAGRHPFRSSNATGTTRRIRAGSPPLAEFRPDLAPALLELVDAALHPDPNARPSAARLATDLRGQTSRNRRRTPGQAEHREPIEAAGTVVVRAAKERAPAALAAALWTAWVAWALPFYPAGWPVGLTAAAAATGLVFPRAALGFAFLVSFFPLWNISLGLAIVFGILGAAWVALTWRDPRGNLALLAGPLLGPVGALALLPLVAQFARGPARRAVQAASGALLAVLVAGLRGNRLPFDGTAPPLGLGIAGSDSPGAVAWALAREAWAHPVALGQGVVLAAAAVALPYLRGRGPWPAALAGCALILATGLGAPTAPFLPLAAAGWVTAVFLAAGPLSPRKASPAPTAESTAPRSGPTRKRVSRFRRREIAPTFSPEGL